MHLVCYENKKQAKVKKLKEQCCKNLGNKKNYCMA